MASQAHSGAALGGASDLHGGDSGAPPAPVLVGNVGQEFVQNTLTTMDPLSAIQACALHAGRACCSAVAAGAGAASSAGAEGGLAAVMAAAVVFLVPS